MKNTFLLFLFCAFISNISGQSYKVNYGNEVKLKKGTIDLDIVYADKTGLFFTESRVSKTTIVGPWLWQTLKKFDKNYTEVFDKDYRKDLKGLDFNGFQAMGEDLFLFATDYVKKEKTFKAFGSRLDKNSGELIGEFIELGNFQLENKRDHYDLKLTPIRNGQNFLMVANISGKEYLSLGVSVLDKNLRIVNGTVIDLAFTAEEFSLEDVRYTPDDKIVLLGKQFEEVQVGRKKKKKMVFKQFVMMVYTKAGRKEKTIVLESGDRFVISGQLIEQPAGGLMLAGFYSNTSKKSDLAGFFINKINTTTGTLELASYKEINAGMIGAKGVGDDNDEDDGDDKALRKKLAKAAKDDDDEDFPNEYTIKSVLVNPADQSIIITSEYSTYRFAEYYDINTAGGISSKTYHAIHEFVKKDILVISADKDGQIKWVNAIPKFQREMMEFASGASKSANNLIPYFALGGGFPYYSSFNNLLAGNQLVIILNDDPANTANPRYGEKLKPVKNFRNQSTVYGISVDLNSGKMTRKIIAQNNSEAVLMPRHGYVLGNEVIMPSWRPKLIGKTELKFAKVTVTN